MAKIRKTASIENGLMEVITVLSEEEIQEATYEQNRFNNSEDGYRTIGKLEWPALLRKLDRIDSSYKS